MNPLQHLRAALLLSLILTSLYQVTAQTTYYVKTQTDGGSDTQDGTTWTTAFATVQQALLAAGTPTSSEPVQIWVATGTYYPDEGGQQLADHRMGSFVLKNHLTVLGGFPSVGEPDLTARDWQQYPTILSGDIDQNDNAADFANHANNSFHVVRNYENNLTHTAVLDGFTISGGAANLAVDSGNFPDNVGGGMLNRESNPTIKNCTFMLNQATWFGGGLTNSYSEAHYINCYFKDNAGGEISGGAHNAFSDAMYINCVFQNNTAARGGGTGNAASDPEFVNCTFVENSATVEGGAAYTYNDNPTYTNCLVWNNTAPVTASLAGAATIAYSLVEGRINNENGNIEGDEDPLFTTNTDGLPTVQGSSPVIDRGTNSPFLVDGMAVEVLTDAANQSRIINAISCSPANVDIGAYEFQEPAPAAGTGVFECLDAAVFVDELGKVILKSTDVFDAANSSPTCGDFNIVSITPDRFTCENVGVQQVEVQATDLSGATFSCMAEITVNDNISPTIVCPDNINTASAQGDCSVIVDYELPVAKDNCVFTIDGLTTTFHNDNGCFSGNMFDIVTTANLTLNGFIFTPKGNGDGKLQFYYKEGTHVGSETNIADWTLLGEEDFVGLIKDQQTESTIGNLDVVAGTTYGIYITVSNNIGLKYTEGTESFSNDDLTVSSGIGLCENFGDIKNERIWNGTLFYSKSLGPVDVTMTAGMPSGAEFTPGTTTITYQAVDANNNDATCNFEVTVAADNQKPIPTESSLADQSAECELTLTPPTATDNCEGSITGTTEQLTYSEPGNYVVTWTYKDNEGNVEIQTQNVSIQDTQKPVPTTENLATASAECELTLTPPTATDNCADLITATTNDPLTYSTNGNYTVTWTYDDGNGNTETQTQNVIIEDTQKPVPTTSDLATINSECGVTLTPPTATDNCADLITATTSDPLTYSTNGNYTVTWTYDDGNGNTETQTQNVVIEDNTAPTIACETIDLTLAADGNYTLTDNDLRAIVRNSTDNCTDVADLVISKTETGEYTCEQIGENVLNLKIADLAGNESETCPVVVNVLAPASRVGMNITEISFTESDETKSITLIVTRTNAACDAAVNYSTVDGTATAGEDYVAQAGVLSFAGGETTQRVTLEIMGGTAYEADENFFLQLSDATNNMTIDVPTTTISILNDDALALEWLSFTAQPTDKRQALLQWQIANEREADYYEIERSSDGITFQVLGKMISNGQNSYQYYDLTPLSVTNYYRIKGIENSGKISYSNTIQLDFNDKINDFTLFPNPTTGQLELRFSEPPSQLEVSFYDALGRKIDVVNHLTDLSNTDFIPLNIEYFAAGVYFIRIDTGESISLERIVKE